MSCHVVPECDLRCQCRRTYYHTLCPAGSARAITTDAITNSLRRGTGARCGRPDQTRPQHDASPVDVVRISGRETELALMSQASKGHPAVGERSTSRVLRGDDSSLPQPNHKLLNWLWVVAACLPPAELYQTSRLAAAGTD